MSAVPMVLTGKADWSVDWLYENVGGSKLKRT
jgi:hypothetical protein